MKAPQRFRWVIYNEHQLTRGFIRTHHLSNFITNGKIDSDKLLLGVRSCERDNRIFWKNVARTELLLMHIASRRIAKQTRSNVSIRDCKRSTLHQLKANHYRNFKTAQLCCKQKFGLITDYLKHPAWVNFQQSLPVSSISNAVKAAYLSRRIARFERISNHSFRFVMPELAADASVQYMESYLRLLVREYVLIESAQCNLNPMIQYTLCFPDASRTLALSSHYRRN